MPPIPYGWNRFLHLSDGRHAAAAVISLILSMRSWFICVPINNGDATRQKVSKLRVVGNSSRLVIM
jgi:hypothetical protein